MRIQLQILFIIFGFSIHAWGVEETKPTAYVLCQSGKIVRTIRIEKQDAQYVTIYTKSGVDREVGSGQFVDSNKKILENIKSNLESAGWKCREIDQARVTEVAE